ncbi:helix-turn-helix transcriptional regulator [Neisseria chenwenguii]|nr:helix-turn-helix transcriptional regulator [Neisseria chenwenguii]
MGDGLAAHIEKALGLPAGWLDDDVQETAAKSSEISPAPPLRFWAANDPLPQDDYAFVPFYKQIGFAGGTGTFEQSDDGGLQLPFGKATLWRKGISKENVFCCTLDGDSMESKIPDGTTLAVDKGATQIKDGKIYAFRHDDLYRVKYLYRLPGGKIRIKSENSFYPDEIVNGEAVEIIGRVFWWSVLD